MPGRMEKVTAGGSRLEKLQALALVLASKIDANDEGHSMAQLARQYRETIQEIESLSDGADEDDLSRILDG